MSRLVMGRIARLHSGNAKTNMRSASTVRTGAKMRDRRRIQDRNHEPGPVNSLLQAWIEDCKANSGHPKELSVVTSLRISQGLRSRRVVGKITEIAHRFFTEIVIGIEIRPETEVGPGLKLFHCYGTVVNNMVKFGHNVTLHQNVTIGARHTEGLCPRIGNRVKIGAGAIIIGDLDVGDGATIGAGAVVLKDVPSNSIAVGNPARIVCRPPGRR